MSFTRFLMLLRARLGLIAGFTVAAVFLAAAVSLTLPKRYYAEATAVLEQPLSDNALLSGGGSISYFLATQRDVVASRAVAGRVIDGLQLERDVQQTQRLMAGANPIGVALGWLRSLLPGTGSQDMSVREWMIERLLKDLSVNSGRDSRLLKVGFNARDPEFSAKVANAFMTAFLDINVHLKKAPARSETAWLEGQLKELREDLAQAEAKLSQVQQEKGIVATDERMDLENLRLTDLSTQLATAQSEAFAADARRKQLQQFAATKGRAGAEVPADVITNPVVARLREDIAQREARLQDMSRQVGPNHPRYLAASGELSQLRGQMSAEMRSVAEGLAAAGNVSGQREASLRAALEQQKQRMLGLKKDRELVTMLARDVDNAQKAYNAAVQRISQSRIESASERPNASVVDQATVPSRPAGPRLTLNVAIGALLGAALGLGIALLLEASQRLVRSGEELAEMLGVPILAVLPPRDLRIASGRALAAGKVVALPRP